MDTIDTELYSTSATSTGGSSGTVTSSDGALSLDYASPTAEGGPGGATNPEQLVAAGLSTCFHEALVIAATTVGADVSGASVEATVRLGTGGGSAPYVFAARIAVTLPGLDDAVADEVVGAARTTCPFTRALEGNIELEVVRAA